MAINIIKVQPDKEGKILIKLYGTEYEIVIEKPKKETKEDKE